MKNSGLLSAIVALIFSIGLVNAQNVSISDVPHTADASAVLDVYSTSLGMLVPRLSSAPSSPATGLLYYDTGSNSFKYNAGTSTSPSWTELSYGSLWSRSGTDTYLSNTGDNVVIGTNSSSGYKFYVYGSSAQSSRFDGLFEVWNVSGGSLDAQLSDDGSGNGEFSLHDASNAGTLRLRAAGNSYFTGGNVCIGSTNPLTLLHIIDPNGMTAPQMQIDNATGTGNASLGFGYTGLSISQGIFGSTGDYTICNTPGLVASAQNDGVTILHSKQSGIVDFNNQSRARVFQMMNPMLNPANPNIGQLIPFANWTPVNFDQKSYDTQTEWTVAPNAAIGPSFFTATEDGYYQVNARVDFILAYIDEATGEITQINYPNYPGYVSIAIFISTDGGQTWNMYAQGNKLQGADNNSGGWNDLQNNLAPNISDVVELHKNDMLEIRVWQNLGLDLQGAPAPIPLRVLEQNGAGGNPTQVYCSIHKSS